MRVLLVAGKGGVGKTTLAAATALAAARDGHRTLLVSTDPAHSVLDVLGIVGPGIVSSDGGGSTTTTLDDATTRRTDVRVADWGRAGEPVPVTAAPGALDVLQIDTRARLDTAWTTLRTTIGALLGDVGVDPLVADEIASVPGVDDVLALLEVGRHSQDYDALVVDCAPTAETLRLLALPEAFDRLVSRGLPLDRRIARLVGPLGLAPAAVEALDALDRLAADLLVVRGLVTGPGTAVRLVTTPERVVLAETQRARTTLALLGHHVDGIVVNRVATGDRWPALLTERHREVLVSTRDRFPELPVRWAPYSDVEPVGVGALLELADVVLGTSDPLDLDAPRAQVAPVTDGSRWYLDVPVHGADPDDVELGLTDDGDLVVDLGPHRRVVTLPPVLRRCDVAGAHLDLTDAGSVLRVTFEPDLAHWSSGAAG